MLKLSNLVSSDIIKRDADIHLTHYPSSRYSGTLCFALNEFYIQEANHNEAISAVITTLSLADSVSSEKGLIIHDSPKKSFFEIHNKLAEREAELLPIEPNIAASARIHPTAQISTKVHIGANVIIEAGAVIKDYSYIEDDCYIGENVVIGARGLHNTMVDGTFLKIEDLGGVYIENGCEILAGAIIQKSYFREFTKIGADSKIGPTVNISHGVQIGKNCLITGNSQIAGFTSIGDQVWVGPSSTIAHGLEIGDRANIKIGSVVVSNLAGEKIVSGNFAFDHKKHLRQFTQTEKAKMKAKALNPCFKGDRQYITGADIYNLSILDLLTERVRNFQNIDLSFHQLTTSNLVLSNGLENDQKDIAFLRVKTETTEGSYFIVETGEQINCRIHFDEESIVKMSIFKSKENSITLEKFDNFSFIEKIVALNKSLLKRLYPEAKGKWYFVRIKLFGNRLEDLNPSLITIKLRKNLSFKITDSIVFADNKEVGSIYFSLK